MSYTEELGKRAKAAEAAAAGASTSLKNSALSAISKALLANKELIIAENAKDIANAKANGIKVGVYFYSQAINPEEAREEADFTLKQIENYELDLPVVFDMEESDTGPNGRILSLSKEEKTECAVTFLHRIQNAGYTPMIYNSTKMYIDI